MRYICEALIWIAFISAFPTCSYIKSQERIAMQSIKECNAVNITNPGKQK